MRPNKVQKLLTIHMIERFPRRFFPSTEMERLLAESLINLGLARYAVGPQHKGLTGKKWRETKKPYELTRAGRRYGAKLLRKAQARAARQRKAEGLAQAA